MRHRTWVLGERHVEKCLDITFERLLGQPMNHFRNHTSRDHNERILVIHNFDLGPFAEP